MNAILASTSPTSLNIMRGALQQAGQKDLNLKTVDNIAGMPAAIEPDTLLMVDWDDGKEHAVMFIEAARKCQNNIKVIAIGSKGAVDGEARGMVAAIVHKPVDPGLLAKSLKQSAQPQTKPRPSVNVEFINPFIESTVNVFSTMCGIDIRRKKLFLKDDHKMLGDISGVMGLSGSATGSVVISLPEKLACIVVARMLGEEPATELNADVADGVGEIINMISGQAKSAFSKTKYQFNISIPSVVSGAGHEITHKKGTPNIVVLFEAEAFEFAVQVCLGAE